MPCVVQENRLLRDTPFLCDFHFRNDLPLPPVGPKLLPVQVDRARITAYQPVGLLWDKPSDAPLEYELALAVDPLDAERYRVPPGGPPVLDPEDEALLVAEPGTGGTGGRNAKRAKMDNNAGWLMRTLYLSDAQLPKVCRSPFHLDCYCWGNTPSLHGIHSLTHPPNLACRVLGQQRGRERARSGAQGEAADCGRRLPVCAPRRRRQGRAGGCH